MRWYKLYCYGMLLLFAMVFSCLTGCTYNNIAEGAIQIETHPSPLPEGGVSGGDDSGGATASGGGGAGKLSPGINGVIRGKDNWIININQGGETPTTPSTTIDANLTN
ncbi:MAG: hypothetical protein GY700_03640 [Propionibacteriaceae bacterium]|nr:hypothetical protein [Propionibacteriaceae bacterium]